MKRRNFIKSLVALLGSFTLGAKKSYASDPEYRWKMVTSWPKNFPGLGVGAENLAELITTLSNNRIKIKVYGANELIPPLEVFDFVSQGGAEIGHSGAYYWKGKSPACQFFSSVPFGLTSQEMNSWLYYGGGLELWEKLYKNFNLIPRPAGNTGVQMGGWFNKEINTANDLEGLKMRIPGLGGEVLSKVGGVPITLAGAEIFTALQTGAIDATEWVGPYNDRAFGLHKVAKYYYYPGWHEPGPSIECIINKDSYTNLPQDLKIIIDTACKAINIDMLSDYSMKNMLALEFLKKNNIEIKEFPKEVLDVLRDTSNIVLRELSLRDDISMEIYNSYVDFKNRISPWTKISNLSYLKTR